MSKIQFDYDKDFNFNVKGSLVSTTKIYTADNFAEQLQGLITTYKQLYTLYIKALENDGKIIGIERSDIISHTDTCIHLLILMITHLRGRERYHLISLDGIHRGFHCSVSVQFDSWSAAGRMAPDMIIPQESLNQFYQETLNPGIRSFLEQYKEFTADKKLDDEEKRVLDTQIKRILTSGLHLRFLLSHCLIND